MKKTIFFLLTIAALFTSCMKKEPLLTVDYTLLEGTYTGTLVQTDCDSAALTKAISATATVQATETGIFITCNTLAFESAMQPDTAGFTLIIKDAPEVITGILVNQASNGYVHGKELVFGVRDERGNHKNYLFQGNKN